MNNLDEIKLVEKLNLPGNLFSVLPEARLDRCGANDTFAHFYYIFPAIDSY